MLSQSLKILFLSGLGLSLFLGHSTTAFAQSRGSNSGGVVVPTEGGGGGGTVRPNTGTRTSTPVDRNTRFSCQYYNGQYTVMYNPESFPGEYFAWAIPRTLGGGWDTQTRCDTIAQRLETYRPDGLVELRSSVENRQNIICVTTEANPDCRIVLTVPPEKDPDVVRNSVFQNLVSADNGEQTVGVNTYTNRGNDISNIGRVIFGGNKKPTSSKAPINLKPFLDRADGGTGTGLRKGVAIRTQQPKPQSGTRLNPNKLR